MKREDCDVIRKEIRGFLKEGYSCKEIAEQEPSTKLIEGVKILTTAILSIEELLDQCKLKVTCPDKKKCLWLEGGEGDDAIKNMYVVMSRLSFDNLL